VKRLYPVGKSRGKTREISGSLIGCLLGSPIGCFLGYLGAALLCGVLYKRSNMCGVVALAFAPVGVIGGGIAGSAIGRSSRRGQGFFALSEVNDLMASWAGGNANDLIAVLGPPNRVIDRGKGKIFISIFDRTSSTPAEVVTREFDKWFDGKRVRANYVPSETADHLAFRVFWINSQNTIYRWAWRGA
jgi:hypothetical protein